MDQRALLGLSLDELRGVVASLGDAQMGTVTNCEPWTVRQLASHALHNQLLWGGIVTGRRVVSVEDTMGAVPHDGDLVSFADDCVRDTTAMWNTDGVIEAVHATPFGELPGSVVIDFPTIDAWAHAWDLSASIGRPVEFPPEVMTDVSALVERVCTDAVHAMGLIKAATEPPADANDTERLMAFAGRTILR